MKRSEVPLDQTWDLSLIYKNSQYAWKDAEELKKLDVNIFLIDNENASINQAILLNEYLHFQVHPMQQKLDFF